MSQQFSRSFRPWGAVILAASLSFACSKKPAETPASEPAPSEPTPSEAQGRDPGQATIEIDPDISSACGISAPEAYFAYNSAKLSGEADGVLQKLVTCFTTGPLAGKTMRLVGHTDPRGDEEYNLTLGGRRADNVKAALSKKGLPDGQMQTTSRGEMEATGSDESSWAKDRKVNIALAK